MVKNAKLKREIVNPEEGITDHLLDYFMEIRMDELVERHSRVKQEYEEQAIIAEQLWISMVDYVVVHSKEEIRVVYRDVIEK